MSIGKKLKVASLLFWSENHTMKSYKEIYECPTSLKQLFRHKYADYLLTDDADDYERLYKITQHLISYKEINTLKKDLNDKYDVVMRQYYQFVKIYTFCKQLRKLILDEKEEKKKIEYKNDLKNACTHLPAINLSVVIVFECLIKNTDLKDIPIPSPNVKSPTDNRLPFNFSDVRQANVF